MNEIRIQKIDGQEFVPLKDYQKLLEKNRNLESDLEKFSEAYKKYRDYEKEELAESCYDLERENKKLKERIAELEKCNLNLQEQIDKQNRDYEPQFENGMPKYKSDLFK